MQYAGSKARHGAFLKDAILPHRGNRRFIEPFCGSLGATQHLQPDEASDANGALIKMHKALLDGWLPRIDLIDEAYYKEHRADDTAEGGFLSHGCAFGGAYKAGFTHSTLGEDCKNYVLSSINSAWNKAHRCANVKLDHKIYSDIEFHGGELVYCDPPYFGCVQEYATTKGTGNTFDSDAFWDWVKYNTEKHDALFFISEYSAPDWVTEHAAKMRTDTLRSSYMGGMQAREVIYRYGECETIKQVDDLFSMSA